MKSRLLYAALVLLIVVLLLIIGYLGSLLFALDPWHAPGRPAVHDRIEADPTEAVAELLVETGDPEVAATHDQDAVTRVHDPEPVVGVIPCVCLDYGLEITDREHFHGPVTHRAVVSAGEVVFFLNLADSAPGGN